MVRLVVAWRRKERRGAASQELEATIQASNNSQSEDGR